MSETPTHNPENTSILDVEVEAIQTYIDTIEILRRKNICYGLGQIASVYAGDRNEMDILTYAAKVAGNDFESHYDLALKSPEFRAQTLDMLRSQLDYDYAPLWFDRERDEWHTKIFKYLYGLGDWLGAECFNDEFCASPGIRDSNLMKIVFGKLNSRRQEGESHDEKVANLQKNVENIEYLLEKSKLWAVESGETEQTLPVVDNWADEINSLGPNDDESALSEEAKSYLNKSQQELGELGHAALTRSYILERFHELRDKVAEGNIDSGSYKEEDYSEKYAKDLQLLAVATEIAKGGPKHFAEAWKAVEGVHCGAIHMYRFESFVMQDFVRGLGISFDEPTAETLKRALSGDPELECILPTVQKRVANTLAFLSEYELAIKTVVEDPFLHGIDALSVTMESARQWREDNNELPRVNIQERLF